MNFLKYSGSLIVIMWRMIVSSATILVERSSSRLCIRIIAYLCGANSERGAFNIMYHNNTTAFDSLLVLHEVER